MPRHLSPSSKERQCWCRHRPHFPQESRAAENPTIVPPGPLTQDQLKLCSYIQAPSTLEVEVAQLFFAVHFPNPSYTTSTAKERGDRCFAALAPLSTEQAASPGPPPRGCHPGQLMLPHQMLPGLPGTPNCQTAVCKALSNPQATSLPVQLQMLLPAHGSADMPRAGRMSLAALPCSGPLSFGLSKVGVVRAPHCQCSGM